MQRQTPRLHQQLGSETFLPGTAHNDASVRVMVVPNMIYQTGQSFPSLQSDCIKSGSDIEL